MDANDATRANEKALPEVLVPYPGQDLIDEMDGALCRLRTIRLALLADCQQIASFSAFDAELMVGEVLDQLDPIRTFLAENMPQGNSMTFLECRREWFARKGVVA